jgi:DNA-binding LacI/PurR family transcriptional regulator
MYDIGVRATQLLLHAMEGDTSGPAESILLESRLVIRDSAG